MLSQTVEYALRSVVHMAYLHPQAQTTLQISEAVQVPKPYLSKVLQSLCKSGIVKSQSGIGGGMSLATDPQQLSLLDVVNAVDPLNRIEMCPLGLKSHGKKLCPLHKRLDNAIEGLQAAFSATTVWDLMKESSSVPPLCETNSPRLFSINNKK